MADLQAAQALGNLPESLRDELLREYAKIVRNYRERRWEAAELDGGRFCEIVYTILAGHTSGSYPATASKPQNFPKSCEALAQSDGQKFPKAVRIGIPRILVGLYDIRNNRGVGHVGGDVDANHMDATYVLHATQWIMADLVRIFHQTDTSSAARIVDALVDRTLPLIWKVDGVRRVLDAKATLADSTLLLLYGEDERATDQTLARDLKQSRVANYRRVLKRLDEQLLVEFNSATGQVFLSPKGEKEVEERLLSSINLS
jgi:hypothetical protein